MKKILSLSILVLFASFTKMYAQAPTVAASAVGTSGQTTSTISIYWTSGNGAKRIVTCSPYGSSTANPVNLTTYTASTTYGAGSNLGSSNYCVYNSTGTGCTILGLTAGSEYTIRIFEYNYSTGNYYLTTHPTYYEYALATQPTTQCSGLTFGSVTTSSATLSLTAGSGPYNLYSLLTIKNNFY